MDTRSLPIATPVADLQKRKDLYSLVAAEFAAPLWRLVRAYEINRDLQRDLFQDIQSELWSSLSSFEGACSLRTWVFRVAHNVGAKYILRQMRGRARHHVSIEDAGEIVGHGDPASEVDSQSALDEMLRLIHQLRAIDRQIMLLYLEDLDAQSIADVTGLSPGNVATKIHRIKQVLAQAFKRKAP
jgi:RNA polymerase sigma-70 factor (ECF subfamily)